MRILLVEDDVMLGDGMVDALRHSGYTVDWLQQGLPALSVLKSEEFSAHAAMRNIPMCRVSCRSRMNFARILSSWQFKRNSGIV